MADETTGGASRNAGKNNNNTSGDTPKEVTTAEQSAAVQAITKTLDGMPTLIQRRVLLSTAHLLGLDLSARPAAQPQRSNNNSSNNQQRGR